MSPSPSASLQQTPLAPYSPSASPSATSASPSATSATLDAATSTGTPSPSPSATSSAQPDLCVSVQPTAKSVKRGQTAAYVIQVSTENGSASDVTVALTSQPTSQKPTFTSGCSKGDGTASCTITVVSDKQAAVLHAQIPVASGATSVKSVKLTATASVVTTAKWTPPAVAQTVAVTAASSTSSAKTPPAGADSQLDILPLGPVPDLNGIANAIIGAGNAASLFPKIAPSPAASPSPAATAGAHPRARKETAAPAARANASAFALGTPVLTAQVIGLLALAFGIMLTVTRLSLRKRARPKGEGS